MGYEVTLGGERLGSGKRNKVYIHGYERSTHNLSYLWRSSMASGTLVPFLTEVALPGDTFDINLDVDVLTHPTIGPLFGNYKIQLDVFLAPFRLYQGKLHMNMLEIGLKMEEILLPQVEIGAIGLVATKPLDNQQISPSCIFSYLGIRGLGVNTTGYGNPVLRKFNAIPYLAYWEIYKQYYANKMEEIGAVIHKDPNQQPVTLNSAQILEGNPSPVTLDVTGTPPSYTTCSMDSNTYMVINVTDATNIVIENLIFFVEEYEAGGINTPKQVPATEYFQNFEKVVAPAAIVASNPTLLGQRFRGYGSIVYQAGASEHSDNLEPLITTFPLKAIDDMKVAILQYTSQPSAFVISGTAPAPYGLPMAVNPTTNVRASNYGQEGLALKTYNSDLFNNWLNTEYIDGAGGISEVTAIDTSGGSFTIDELNMSKKIYNMLNRIMVSGGSYDDWLDAVYTSNRNRSTESPVYLGGLIRNLVFQEVVSNSKTIDQPLGTLAGRGTMGSKNKGGKIIVKVDEPSYIMGIISITPNIDYSQGNKWDTNLATMDDLHKPALDEIGFQNLVTDQMAWFDTKITAGNGAVVYKSAGKQPAWINYMTNVNQVRGNFADQSQQMFMTLNRRYEGIFTTEVAIKDLTTYIDPSKFNHIFADTRRDAQNFWAQIAVDIQARRKMSAKVMPNL